MKKETFCKIINALAKSNKTADDLEEVFIKALKNAGRDEFATFGSFFGMLFDYNLENELVNALEKEMNDTGEWIQYYCWELNYGTLKDNLVKIDGLEFELDCPEKLYDLLIYNNSTRCEKDEKESKPVSLTIEQVTDILKKYSKSINE